MLPELPKARQRMLEMWNKAFFLGFHSSDPFVAQIPIRAQKEGKAASIGGGDIKYQKMSVTSSFKAREAEGMTVEEFFGMATKLGKDLGGEQAKGVFQAMSKPTPHGILLRQGCGGQEERA
jgi:hypothetical protein